MTAVTDAQLADMVRAAGGDAWQEGANAHMEGDHVFKLDASDLRKLLALAATQGQKATERRDPLFEAHFPAAAGCWDGTGYTDHRICYASAGWRAALATSQPNAAESFAEWQWNFANKHGRNPGVVDAYHAVHSQPNDEGKPS